MSDKEKKQPLFCVYKNMEEGFFGDFWRWQHVRKNKHLWLCVYKIVNRGGCYFFWVLTNSNSIASTSENVYIQPRLNKMVLLCLEAYNSGLEACIGTCRDIVGFLRFSAFIWAQEVQNSVHWSLRKLCLKRATLTWKWA